MISLSMFLTGTPVEDIDVWQISCSTQESIASCNIDADIDILGQWSWLGTCRLLVTGTPTFAVMRLFINLGQWVAMSYIMRRDTNNKSKEYM